MTGPFGVYVHWPYCAAICPYCDFNVRRDRGGDHAPLRDAIRADLRGWRTRTGPRVVGSVYLGGGTPSRLSPSDVAAVLETVAAAWTVPAGAEITLEINPEDAAPERLAGFRAAGVTRASVGVQALNDADLAALGRWHDAAAARAAVERALAVFDQVSFDLIYARAGQSRDAWSDELRDALALAAPHLSLYQLTIEPNTAFARRAARGTLVVPDADAAAGFHDRTQELCDAAGRPAYEVSNHAADAAAQSAHNLLYWRSHEWAGVGPGAHGRLGAVGGRRRALAAERALGPYQDRVAATGWGVATDDVLEPIDQARELLVMGLRTTEGVEAARLSGVAPVDADVRADLADMGLLEPRPDRLIATSRGRLLADRLALELAPDASPPRRAESLTRN